MAGAPRPAWRLALAIVLAAGLAACGRPAPSRPWVAARPTIVYQAPDEADVVAFQLAPGDRCLLGAERIAKAYRYVEIDCPGKGHGWAVDVP